MVTTVPGKPVPAMAQRKTQPSKEPAKRCGKPTRAGLLLPQAAATAYRKHGFAESRLVTDWQAIVGERLAEVCLPDKLGRDSVLSIRVAPAFALELQHLEPKILERIATFFGHRAVTRLKLRQGDVVPPDRPKAHTPRPLTDAEEAKLKTQLDGIDDPGLREALERLGRAVLGTKPAA